MPDALAHLRDCLGRIGALTSDNVEAALRRVERERTSAMTDARGWKMVPVVPTEAMKSAVGWPFMGRMFPYQAEQEMTRMWSAMLAAAPTPPPALTAAPEPVEGMEERARLEHVIDRDRYIAAAALNGIERAIRGRRWLSEPGRGSYAWDDERYQQEFGFALAEIEAALVPLRRLATDKTDCTTDPTKVAAARADAAAALAAEAASTARAQGMAEGEKRATAAERERCARIVEGFFSPNAAAECLYAEQIAAAIRTDPTS